MKIRQYVENKTRIFELSLNKKDLEKLSFLDGQGILSPYSPSDARFHLFPQIGKTSDAFQILPTDTTTYYVYVDVGMKTPEEIGEELSRSKIPIEMDQIIGNKPINLGYVKFKIC